MGEKRKEEKKGCEKRNIQKKKTEIKPIREQEKKTHAVRHFCRNLQEIKPTQVVHCSFKKKTPPMQEILPT
jgi:hypothetical protein